MINPYMIIGGLAAIGGSFVLGVQVGSNFASGQCNSTRLADAQNSSKIIFSKEAQLTQCEAQVDKFNQAIISQEKQINAFRREQTEAREKAASESRLRDAEIAASQIRVQSALNKLKGQLDELELSPCAGAIVDTSLIELLNTELRTAAGSNSGSDGELSSSED
ncbi:MAG: hypothetical protein AAFP81_00740 [Pseudomonadota bacterium]